MTLKERDLMGGLAKGLKVIEAFTADRPKLSIAEAADVTGYDRATTRRCLLTLAELGYCAYDGKYFTVTPRILRLGTGCLAAMPLPRIVQPYLDQLSEQIHQSTSVSILDGSEIVYVARAAQQRVMSVTLMPGSRLPAYCTSMGRVLLAALPEEQAKDILMEGPLHARTPRTETSPRRLLDQLRHIREHGFAAIDQEVEMGLRSIAVPLTDFRQKTVAALNVGFAATTEPLECLVQKYLPSLQAIQAEISGTLR
ncbi:IclR family transcriptional regulator C-terminal domain-containing protein [Brucella sp. NBRC 12950]|jgi:IclR family pca regulon transcriptional regulator|uniref:IclR family transcriptional regulator domain-containing protein n=1 Tax=Brucella sp. NBRC 12950 TaxID=2994518 RepID=UPI0024A5D118|nr:IclR family transcriptional regulator C-terminal domain-containing protein [Brucella sp. NBRC 12950]GLU30107.1 IclR family transcriptional regulator [Brucella sp. NBRC 12950]